MNRIRTLYTEYPRQFWLVVGTAFIDHFGGALLFPFFALYITRHFGVGMTEVGILFALNGGATFIGSMLGGALADHLGRKSVILVGLVVSALASLGMGFANRLEVFYLLSILAGLFAEAAGPAHQAMITDLLPEEKRADGFGIMRIATNVTMAIGPALGGLLAAYSYLSLFLADTITSLITAFIFYHLVEETHHQHQETGTEQPQNFRQSLKGYVNVLRDGAFMAFVFISIISVTVYIQMYSTLSVYLRDVHGVPEQGFGIIMSMNAAMVVFLQFVITRKVSKWPAMLVMALGSLLYAIGFGMYGLVNAFWLFMLAMAIITLGEMVTIPVAQAVVSKFAPEDKRGRYMAIFGISWMLPSSAGPLLAGMIMDNADPRWVWYAAGILGILAALGYIALHTTLTASRYQEQMLPTKAGN